MQKIRRFLLCCLIWVGLVPGRSVLAADAATGSQDPAARARLELERQGNASQSANPATPKTDSNSPSAAELQRQAKTLAAKQTTAPGPKVRYATSRPVKLPPPPSAEEVARRDRLAQIEREVARRQAERAGKAPAVAPVANKPQQVSPVPPAASGVAAPAPVVVSREAAPASESEEKQRNQSLREKLAADRARLAADREAAEQQKAQQRNRREGLPFSNQAPPPVGALAATPAPATPAAPAAPAPSSDEAARKARVQQVQSDLESKKLAQNSVGAPSRPPAAAPAPSLPVLSLEQERKARELLRQTLAELEKEEAAAAGKKAKPSKPAPAAAAAPSAPAPAPTAPAPSPELELKRQEELARQAAKDRSRQEADRAESERKAKAAQAKIQADRAEAERRSKQAQEAQAKSEAKAQADRAEVERRAKQTQEAQARADAKAQAERAKAEAADKARAEARLQEAKSKLHNRNDAERAADTQAKSALTKKAPAAAPQPAPTPVAAPTTRAEKLAALLKAYTRSDSPISAEEYHKERAKILSEP